MKIPKDKKKIDRTEIQQAIKASLNDMVRIARIQAEKKRAKTMHEAVVRALAKQHTNLGIDKSNSPTHVEEFYSENNPGLYSRDKIWGMDIFSSPQKAHIILNIENRLAPGRIEHTKAMIQSNREVLQLIREVSALQRVKAPIAKRLSISERALEIRRPGESPYSRRIAKELGVKRSTIYDSVKEAHPGMITKGRERPTI